MSRLTNLFKFALDNFYPSQTTRITSNEGEELTYEPLTTDLNNRLNNNYLNGIWYLNRELPSSIGTVPRRIEPFIYFVIDTNEVNLFTDELRNASTGLLFKTKNFHITDTCFVRAYYTKEDGSNGYFQTYEAGIYNKEYIYLLLPDYINRDNFVKVSIGSEEKIHNYCTYTTVPNVTYRREDDEIQLINKSDVDTIIKRDKSSNEVVYVMQKLNKVPQAKIEGSNILIKNVTPCFYVADYMYTLNIGSGVYSSTADSFKDTHFNETYIIPYETNNVHLQLEPTIGKYDEDGKYYDRRYSGYYYKLYFNNLNGNEFTTPTKIEGHTIL